MNIKILIKIIKNLILIKHNNILNIIINRKFIDKNSKLYKLLLIYKIISYYFLK